MVEVAPRAKAKAAVAKVKARAARAAKVDPARARRERSAPLQREVRKLGQRAVKLQRQSLANLKNLVKGKVKRVVESSRANFNLRSSIAFQNFKFKLRMTFR